MELGEQEMTVSRKVRIKILGDGRHGHEPQHWQDEAWLFLQGGDLCPFCSLMNHNISNSA